MPSIRCYDYTPALQHLPHRGFSSTRRSAAFPPPPAFYPFHSRGRLPQQRAPQFRAAHALFLLPFLQRLPVYVRMPGASRCSLRLLHVVCALRRHRTRHLPAACVVFHDLSALFSYFLPLQHTFRVWQDAGGSHHGQLKPPSWLTHSSPACLCLLPPPSHLPLPASFGSSLSALSLFSFLLLIRTLPVAR